MKSAIKRLGSLGILFCAAPTLQGALFTSGHGGVFAIGYEGGSLEPHLHMEGGVVDGVPQLDVEFEPEEITVVVPLSTFDYVQGIGGRAADASWDLLGVGAGESYWFLPQSNSGLGGAAALGAPFAGVASGEMNPANWSSQLAIELMGMTGPGEFSLWQDGITPTFFMASSDGITGADTLNVDVGGHDHLNWGFTAPGDYTLDVTVSGTHLTDGFQTASATYSFSVAPEPSSLALLVLAGCALQRRQR